MALQIATVTNAIASLSVSGLTILDKHEVPVSGRERQSILMPLPQFISEFTMTRESYGGGSSAKMTVTYTLHYRLLYKPVGSERTNEIKHLSGLVDLIARFWDAVLAIDVLAGAVDIIPAGIEGMGMVADPSDNPFWGCDLALQITEFVN